MPPQIGHQRAHTEHTKTTIPPYPESPNSSCNLPRIEKHLDMATAEGLTPTCDFIAMLDHGRSINVGGRVDLQLQAQLDGNTTRHFSGMRLTSPDLALPFQGCPVVPNNQDIPRIPKKNTIPACKTSSPPIEKITRAEAPPSPRPNRLKLFHRRTSSSASALSKSCSFYAGPQPTGLGGCLLKSCIKPSRSTNSRSSDVSVRRCSGSGHRVSFSHVQLREYCRQVGDNPCVSSGCPLAIGWKFNKRGKMDIDSYEADRVKCPIPCQRISSKKREKLLTEIGGVSHTQIMQGQIQAYFDRQLRAETLNQIGGLKNYKSVGPRERLSLMKESAARKLDRLKGSSPTQAQRELWDNAHETARQRSLPALKC
mmetsp:Transcript_18495/g.40027  ORF Transcript_18495/g.40027 Transcript_18495/m.40027 type:complete len:368 (+) Transcript_18495:172-1275(+)